MSKLNRETSPIIVDSGWVQQVVTDAERVGPTELDINGPAGQVIKGSTRARPAVPGVDSFQTLAERNPDGTVKGGDIRVDTHHTDGDGKTRSHQYTVTFHENFGHPSVIVRGGTFRNPENVPSEVTKRLRKAGAALRRRAAARS